MLRYLAVMLSIISVSLIVGGFGVVSIGSVINLAIGAVVAMSFIYLVWMTRRFASLNTSYNVAILGFPRSGKTILLTTLFGEMFANKIGIRAVPKGDATINTINHYLSQLAKGESLGPTTSTDRTAFTADLTVGGKRLGETYRVEFGDFPGDDYDSYVNQFGPWLHTTPFFRWVLHADAIVFIVDIGRILNPRENRASVVAQESSAIRAAWQHMIDTEEMTGRDFRRLRIVLAFTKADLFQEVKNYNYEESEVEILEDRIFRLGFTDIPPIRQMDLTALNEGSDEMSEEFSELIGFLRDEVRNLNVIFVSSFGLIEDKRLGLEELLLAVLPNR